MPKGRVEPRRLQCRACGTAFISDRIGRQSWYCQYPKCVRARITAARRADRERRRERRARERDLFGQDLRTLTFAVAQRLRGVGVGYPSVREAARALGAAEGHAAKADAAHALAIEALALTATLRRRVTHEEHREAA